MKYYNSKNNHEMKTENTRMSNASAGPRERERERAENDDEIHQRRDKNLNLKSREMYFLITPFPTFL